VPFVNFSRCGGTSLVVPCGRKINHKGHKIYPAKAGGCTKSTIVALIVNYSFFIFQVLFQKTQHKIGVESTRLSSGFHAYPIGKSFHAA
jgi:hypothetical protein